MLNGWPVGKVAIMLNINTHYVYSEQENVGLSSKFGIKFHDSK